MGTSSAFDLIVMPVLQGVGSVVMFFVVIGMLRALVGLPSQPRRGRHRPSAGFGR